MRNKNGIISISIIGLIVVAFSIATFFLLKIERIAFNYWAMAFLLLSEFVLFLGLIGLRFTGASHNTLFLRSGVSVTLSLYFAATLISVLFAGALEERLDLFILVELAIIVLFAIIMISIFAWSYSTARRNKENVTKVGTNEPKRGGF